MTTWQTVGRPGYFGNLRDAKYVGWDKQYGKENWRIVWKVLDMELDFLGACVLYEAAYLNYLVNAPSVVASLIVEAKDIYDDEESNVNSGLDYTKQETLSTHVQDITIRRCLVNLGVWFKGSKLIRIRQEQGQHPLSMVLSPGRVPFHIPEFIHQPEISDRWWQKGSVESFYQSNKFLQVKQ